MLDEAWSLIERFRLAHLFHTSYAHLAAGWIHRERGELAEAESSLVASQEHVEQWKDIPIAVQHTELTSRTRWSLGDRVAPPDLLDQAERLTSGRPASSHFPDRIDLARARLDLLDGEPVHAARRLPGWRSRLDGGAGTPRERILLGTHLTYPEIADELFVSYNTARSHAKAIYRKLAVSSRAGAVDRARDLGLLDRGVRAE